MGCACTKPAAVEDIRDSPKGRLDANKVSRSNSSRREEAIRLKSRRKEEEIRLSSLRREEKVASKKKLDRGDGKVSSFDTKSNGSTGIHEDQTEKKKGGLVKSAISDYPGKGRVPMGAEGEQVAAGWPTWLSSVASEAINGWIPRRANTFEKLEKIGQGTYSSVYKARDINRNRLVALKRIRFDNLDVESVKFMAREILILRRLHHPNVIKLEGLIATPRSCSLYLVFEYMEHDLTGLSSRPGLKFTEPQIKCYMQQLLRGLDYCHKNGVLHRDIKGSNLLIDDNGILKIADFGLASFYDANNSAALTSRVVTLWYRPPELLLGVSHYGVAVDLWSVGCILAELYFGNPFLPGKTEVEQLHKIFKVCGSPSEDYWRKLQLPHAAVFKPPHQYRRCVAELLKEYPPAAVALVDTLLSIEPSRRGTAAAALKSQFFATKPLACDPSGLPKYPPSKEIDTKIRDAARRQEKHGGKGRTRNGESRPARDSKDCLDPNLKVEFGAPLFGRQGHSSSVSRSDLFNPRSEQPVSGFLVAPPGQTRPEEEESRESDWNRLSHSGQLINEPTPMPTRASLSTLSGLVAARISTTDDHRDRAGPSHSNPVSQRLRSPKSAMEMESKRKYDRKRHAHRVADSYEIENQKSRYAEQPTPNICAAMTNKIYASGPILGSSDNVEQILKERDRQIQEFAREARNGKFGLVTGSLEHGATRRQ